MCGNAPYTSILCVLNPQRAIMEKILIRDLTVQLQIGVTEKEQRRSQKVLISMEIHPAVSGKIDDALENTIDYSAVRRGVKSMLREERFNLIETVADRTAHHVLDNYRVKEITVTVKKFPYKDTAYVGYRLSLGKPE